METNAVHGVDEVRRHRLEVYRSQISPAWAWPAFGIAVFLFLSSYELRATWVHIAVPMAYALFVGIWIGMINARSGVQPRLRGMPKPLFGEVVRFWVAGALMIGAAVAVGLVVSFLLAGALAGVGTVAGGRYYDRR
jgi:hypothetical protein